MILHLENALELNVTAPPQFLQGTIKIRDSGLGGYELSYLCEEAGSMNSGTNGKRIG